MNIPQYSLVTFKIPNKIDAHLHEDDRHMFYDGPFVLLGEIAQMPGHAILLGKSNKIYQGYHTSNFRVLTDNEV